MITARETRTQAGYLLDGTPQSITIRTGEVQSMTFWNKKAGGLIINKIDALTKKPLAGVKFKITYADGSNVDLDGGKVSSNGLYTTNAEGPLDLLFEALEEENPNHIALRQYSLFITVMSFILLLTVYGRFFRLYMFTALAPLPLASFAGEGTAASGKAFLKSYIGVCMEGAVIVLAFVDWVFYNMSGGSYVIGHGGGARMQHSYCTPISWSQAQPGDLVFYPEDTHVGIVGGWDESGNIQIIHCASGQNNVVITGKAGFTSIGRPDYYG